MTLADDTPEQPQVKWIPIEAAERRVLGVLVEKAKTTPDNYPLSLNGIKSGANQKSNRFPQMELSEDQIMDTLESLRDKHAVSFIQGDGRVEKYRHLAYDWLGVDKVELAVMAELLLRGAQTIGELRGRASRMEPIKSMSDLGPILQSLQAKSLVIYLTPPGRGAKVTHNLYQPREIEKVRREHGIDIPPDGHPVPQPAATEAEPVAPPAAPPAATPPAAAVPAEVASAADSAEIDRLRKEVASLRNSLAGFREDTESQLANLRNDLDDLLRQLG